MALSINRVEAGSARVTKAIKGGVSLSNGRTRTVEMETAAESDRRQPWPKRLKYSVEVVVSGLGSWMSRNNSAVAIHHGMPYAQALSLTIQP